ncbi:MAG: hypothetical protein HZB81_04150 [Deltaproteobacteria bacterium]|nr:hypothetical protein [Deltaproteobacteria bacterium]
MLAIDIPISLLAGLALAEAGKKILKSGDAQGYRFMRTTIVFFAVFFITPIPFYFFMGWPAWETNFLWKWPDNIHDSPLMASVSFAAFILTVGPAYLGFEVGRYLIKNGRENLVRAGYISMGILVGVIVFLTRDITFNIASTYARYEAKEFYSFWSHPFFTGWLIVTIYFWGSLVIFYLWIKKKGGK